MTMLSSYEPNGCIIEHDGATLTCTVAASHWNGGHVLVDCIRHGYSPNVAPMATFVQIEPELAKALIAFIGRRNLKKSIEVSGVSYTLDYISHNSSAFWRSRGLSAYFVAESNVIRISDHWSKSNNFERSRKLNCGHISGKFWAIENNGGKVYCSRYAGKYPFEMLAGRASIAELSKTCDHWKEL